MHEIVIDTEATGLDSLGGHRIVEIGMIEEQRWARADDSKRRRRSQPPIVRADQGAATAKQWLSRSEQDITREIVIDTETTGLDSLTTRRELQAYLWRRLGTFINPLV
jgi:DNA polymerase III epsilon subunit-like protein